jgi:hypothetical protein
VASSSLRVKTTFYNRSHDDAVIRVYDAAGNVIQTHEHKGRLSDASANRCFKFDKRS